MKDLKMVEVYFHTEQDLYKKVLADAKRFFGEKPTDGEIASVIVLGLRGFYNK